MPSIKKVAEIAGVSVGTVSHVITGSVNVSEPLRLKVQAAIRQLNYHEALGEFLAAAHLKPDFAEAYGEAALAASGDVAPDLGIVRVVAQVEGALDELVEA